MKILNIFKKVMTYSLYLLLIFTFVYLVYFINTQDPSKKRLRKELKSIVKKNTFIKNLYNDYREDFLPDTQFIKVDFKKIDLDFLNLNGCYFGKCYTFFLEQYNKKLIIADRKGNIKTTTFKSLDKNDPIFSNIQTNLNFDYILDTHVYKNDIYITGKKDIGDKTFLEIVRGKFDEKKINFENIIKLSAENCVLRHAVHSGKIQIYNNNENKILLAVNHAGGMDGGSLENLSADSICGKILLIDAKNKSYEIFSSGHRNISGLYTDKDVIISAEHGPHAGDEINKIKKGNKYGWPIVSHGEKYSRDKNDEEPNYKKNHKENGFEEPIFSFVPAIGISEIIKLPNNFSKLWQDNFLLASLHGKYLYRIRFDDEYNKIIYYEPIFIGDRIRDLIYNNNSKKILLALELEGALGIITNQN